MLRGHVDILTSTVLAGWAVDLIRPNEPVDICIFVDGHKLAQVTCDHLREDLIGIEGLGKNTKIGGSLIVMSIVGGAVLTPLMGWISQTTHHISLAYGVPLICYFVIAIYSFLWQRMQTAETATPR